MIQIVMDTDIGIVTLRTPRHNGHNDHWYLVRYRSFYTNDWSQTAILQEHLACFGYNPNNIITYLDRNRPTCVWGLMEARLPEIKATCRYKIHKPPYPRSINRLHGNTFLLTNISQLRFHCPTQQFGDNNTEHTLDLQRIRTIHKFDCHCDMIHADDFCIVPDLYSVMSLST